MKSKTELQTEGAGVVTAIRAIESEFEGKAVPAEKRDERSKLITRGMEIKADLETIAKSELETKDMADLTRFLERPAGTAPFPVGPAHAKEGVKALTERGWEQKGGVWCAMTSKGLYPMYSDDVLFGNAPEDSTPEELKFIATARAAMQPSYKAAYGKYLRTATKFRSEAMAFARLEGFEQKALSEGSDTAGGFLVPPDYQAEMLVRKAAMAVVRRAGARVQPTSRDVLRYPAVAAAAVTAGGVAASGYPTADSIFSSGFIGSWAGETPTFTDVDPVFQLFQITVKKIRAATKLSNDFVADSVVDVVAWLARNGAENMALVEDMGFLLGDGTALKPKGIVNCGATGVNIAGSTANTISNTTSNTGSAPKLISLWAALPPQYDPGARMLMTKASEGAVRKLVDAQGRFLWPVNAGSGFGAPPRQIQGADVENTQFLVDGTVANSGLAAIIYGDLSNYIIAERAQISTVILRERFADTDQLGIILFERVGGDVWNLDAFRLGTL